MLKAALALSALVLLCFIGTACLTLPSPRQPTPGPVKDGPVNETLEDSGGLSDSPGGAWDRSLGFGQAWGHRRGSFGTSLIIVLVLVVVSVTCLAIWLSHHPLIR